MNGAYGFRADIAQVLVVDDNRADADLTRRILRESAVRNRCHIVGDGASALQFLRRTGDFESAPRPDLVLLDLHLPKRDGREVLAEVKGDPTLRRIPIIVLSTSDADDDIESVYALSANCYVPKPPDLDEYSKALRETVEFWLDVARLPPRR